MGRGAFPAAIGGELLKIPSFRGCSAKQLAQIDRLTDRVEVPPGRVVVAQGIIGRECYLIVSGTASVICGGRLVTTLGPGDHFGEIGAIEAGRRTATLTAVSHLSALAIGPREFSTLVADIPGFRDMLLRGMAKRLRAADDTIESMMIVLGERPGAEVRQLAHQN
jgi:CRP-like cAMP-binding protein